MALYRGKYDLQGLAEISPEMEKDLDLAYEICMSYRGEFPCEMCGKCCHQPNIIIRPDEVERVCAAAGTDLYTFMTQYVYQTGDGRILFNKRAGEPCRFLGKDNRCTIWKDRPQICDDFPYLVSMFMSRVYLALTNEKADILRLIDYMDDSWPCTKDIKRTIAAKVEEGRRKRPS
ncbi:Uncharacterized protein family (UPF0153) [Thermoplasmatales archaeon BRNA1]|nr:Uncharacterized protein family (UPF0153) [Thermoplasmatales archaeon BRNA1]